MVSKSLTQTSKQSKDMVVYKARSPHKVAPIPPSKERERTKEQNQTTDRHKHFRTIHSKERYPGPFPLS